MERTQYMDKIYKRYRKFSIKKEFFFQVIKGFESQIVTNNLSILRRVFHVRMKEGTCEYTDSSHSHKEPSIRQTRGGENNFTRQLRIEKKVKISIQFQSRDNPGRCATQKRLEKDSVFILRSNRQVLFSAPPSPPTAGHIGRAAMDVFVR